MRLHAQRITRYNWWQAGRVAGTAPTEWEMTEYGRDYAQAYLDLGMAAPDAINLACKAVYDYAYADVRDSIGWKDSRPFPLVPPPAKPSYDYDCQLVEVVDMMQHSGATASEIQALYLHVIMEYSYAEIGAVLGVSESTARRKVKRALQQLKGQIDG